MGKRQKCKRQTRGLYGGLGETSASMCRPTILSILVLSDMVDIIIGRCDSTIKEIMEQTSVRINVNEIFGNLEKAITIYGTPENCTIACRKILEVVQQKAIYTNKSDVILKILIHENRIGLAIGEEDNIIRNIMSETETKINVYSNVDITINNINYKSICTVEGSIENVSKAESQISAKIGQSLEKYLQPMANCVPSAIPVIRNKQTESMLCILVHSDIVGVIIGRGGSTIKEIIEQTSARIIVNKSDIVGSLGKPIAIYGTPENCTNACRKILEVVHQKVTYTNKSNVILRILIQDNLIGLIIGEEGNTIRNIVSETETKINVFKINNITIDDINYKSVCAVEGSIENISKAESQISTKLRQSFEKYLPDVAGCQIHVELVSEMRNFSKMEMGLPNFSNCVPGAIPVIRNKQTESMLCILVHSDMVHAIIGNCGSKIKAITQQTSTWVHVQPKDNFVNIEQAIIIKGNPEKCTNACLKMLEVFQETNTCSSDVILKILIPDNLIGIIIEEEGYTIKKIMSETETKISVSSITGITIDSFNYNRICMVEGLIENISKAEGQISAKLRQSIEHFLQSVDVKVEPALEMRNLCEIGLTRVSHVGPKTIPAIENREFTLRILVQSNMISVIIGKRGSTIKEITQQTSARIHVDQKDSVSSTEKAITIRGIPENCTNACRKILDVMQKKNAATTYNSDVILKILVHDNRIGAIIGQERNTVRKIMSETDTNIIVPSITDITIDSFNNERIFTVEGSVENISKAEAQMSAKLRQCFDNKSHYKLIRLVKSEITNKKYKLMIVGHSKVGKSSIIKRYCKDVYTFTKPTIGMDIQQIFVRFNKETINLEIRDTSGTENYQSLASSYRGAHGVFIVYDITDFDSSFKLDRWIKDIETFSDPGTVIMLIGSKCDDTSNRKISIEEGQKIAEVYRIPFLEVSSKTNVNIDKLFYIMISRIHNLQQQPINIKKELEHMYVTNKPKLDSDVKPNAIPVLTLCSTMEKELPDTLNIEHNYREQYKLIRVVKPGTSSKKFKLIIVGHSNVGKSTIINHFCNGVYQDTIPTTGVDFREIFVRFENKTIHLNIWDTAGTEKYRSLAQQYYRGAHGIFIVYDITDLNSSFKLDDWINDVKNFSDLNAVKILIGNKCDDTLNRKVSVKEGQEIAKKYGFPFFEVSSKINVNIDKLLYTMISRIHDLQNQPTDIKKELNDINVTNKPNTTPVQCPIMRIKPETPNHKYKLIIVGNSNVGKSTIIHHISKGVYKDNISDTKGMDFQKIFISLKNKAIELNIWDTAGAEKYRSLAQQYYRGAHGIFIVYDITDLNSSFILDYWINDVEDFSDLNAVKILIGSKCDDTSNRKVSFKEGQDFDGFKCF
ncbi:uncharacterized protein LOC100167988 isoform X3 [Acyrthosiphon pisum]|uniref:K Homology domain-containing protein n=1 Tax=Acyrthosiphon pisum TaxID=7029 RepID=A0A8R2H811_ACYPI|nr:uncharacterized protein LOC100167988 isoform X3 [Acyrthosiphon pisum]|eukprot:XP_016659964.1 PREDICTED: uncharacterized protein LOC100167988 isoform X3 [Acyrthosiphon pisum]